LQILNGIKNYFGNIQACTRSLENKNSKPSANILLDDSISVSKIYILLELKLGRIKGYRYGALV
jgi:hypothetical protein